MKIVEVAFIGYPVTEPPRARDFYERVLGLSPSRVFGEGDRAWIEYDLGPVTFAISNMGGESWRPSPNGPCVAFEMENFETAITELKAKSVPFDLEPMETPVCRMAVIADPDGNKVTIHKRHSTTSHQ
ncbi:MAG: VOC family protein [Verrucomicrobia bacterium]|nr:VOC family protein [Verrucomicrobiota bacterium]